MRYRIKIKQQWTEYDSEQTPLLLALTGAKMTDPLSISAVGAGGKTSLLMHLKNECEKQNLTVLVTTTTHMFLPERELTIPSSRETAVIHGRTEETPSFDSPTVSLPQTTYLGLPVKPEIRKEGWIKCQSPFSEALETYRKSHQVTLMEADGSRRLPMKIPGSQEPAVPAFTDIILVVYGLSALGLPLCEVCQRWELLRSVCPSDPADTRTESFPSQLSFPETEPVTPALLGKIMREGYLKPLARMYPNARILPVWNQADTDQLINDAKKAAHFCGGEIHLITSFAPWERNGI